MTGVDPEGADLRRGGERARIPFPVKVEDAAGCRQALVGLTRAARQASAVAVAT